MTENEVFQKWAYFEYFHFKMTNDERHLAVSFMNKTAPSDSEHTSYTWTREVLEKLLGAIEVEERAIARGESGAKLAATIIQAFFEEMGDRMLPVSEAYVKGAGKALDITMRQRIVAAKVDPIAFDISCQFAAVTLEREGQLDQETANFVIAVLLGEISRPSPKRGGNWYANWPRDSAIVDAIETAQLYGLQSTRNDASSEISACDVVADVLSDMGFSPTTFGGVKRIWLNRGIRNASFLRAMTGN